MKSKFAAVLSFAASMAAGPVLAVGGPPLQSGQHCFYAGDVSGFAVQGDHIVNVRVAPRDVYQFELVGSCPAVNWHARPALESRGTSFICTGLDAELVAPGASGPRRCPVRNIRKLTPDEITALPNAARP